jgi:cupin superfamily acireductone dioxygenase involved in methionine salvage
MPTSFFFKHGAEFNLKIKALVKIHKHAAFEDSDCWSTMNGKHLFNSKDYSGKGYILNVGNGELIKMASLMVQWFLRANIAT